MCHSRAVRELISHRMFHYSAKTLTEWMASDLPLYNSRALGYFSERTACVLDILDVTENINTTAYVAQHPLI